MSRDLTSDRGLVWVTDKAWIDPRHVVAVIEVDPGPLFPSTPRTVKILLANSDSLSITDVSLDRVVERLRGE
jgi:hypothetical protein